MLKENSAMYVDKYVLFSTNMKGIGLVPHLV